MRLNGHSGCILSLKEHNGKYIVEKKSNIYKYNDRLKSQCVKQCQFSSAEFHRVDILNYGYDKNGLFFFDMEYIPGITLAEYMRDIPLSEVGELASKLFCNINTIGPYDTNAKSVFKEKVDQVSGSIKRNGIELCKIVELLKQYQWPYIIPSYCHGDLTLENIIIYRNQIYLLDFLDSFYDSWIIDFAKILQDVDIFWHYRSEPYIDNNLYLRLLILKESLIEKILCLTNGQELMESVYYTLLLNILRIFPYTTDQNTMSFLKQKTEYIYKRIINRKWR